MLTSKPSPEPDEPDGRPALRRSAPMTSIQQFESPDAAEAHVMADQRAADQRSPEQPRMSNRPTQDRSGPAPDRAAPDRAGPDRTAPERPGEAWPARGTDRVRPAAPAGAGASGPAVADIQTTSGVPKVVIPAAVRTPAEAPPATDDDTASVPKNADVPVDQTDQTDQTDDSEQVAQVAPAPARETKAAPDIDADAETATVRDAETGTVTDAEATTGAESDAGTETDADAETGTVADAETGRVAGAEATTVAESDAEAETDADAETGTVADPDAATTPDPDTETAPDTDAETGAVADVEFDADTTVETGTVTDADAATTPHVDAETATDTDAVAGAEDASETPADAEPAGEAAAAPESEGDANAAAGPPAETDIAQVEGGKADTAPDPQPQPEGEVEPDPERDPEAQVEAEAEPAIDETVVLTLPERTALPPQTAEHPDPEPDSDEDTLVLQPRDLDDTVVIPVIPAAAVPPPGEAVTAVIPVVPGLRESQPAGTAARAGTPPPLGAALPLGTAPPPGAASPADPGRVPRRARARREPLDLGHAPAVLTISALGVLMVALAYAGGRVSTGNAQFAYWVGQVVVFTPVVVRLLSRRMAGVAESFVLVMGLALHQYLLKWMYSPDQFRFPDELQHWLATTIIVQSGELFRPNPALPPAEHFPGLAELGAAVTEMTGLPVTAAGVIVAGIAHLVFVGVLFAVVLRASNSPAVAGVACATYATALHYLFFNSMFLYQTAALPFFMLTIWAVRRSRAEGGRAFAVLAVASMALTTVSHHVTALALVATLLLLAVAELAVDRPRRWSALVMPAIATVVVAAWILLVATDVLGYLEEPVDQVRRTVSQLFTGESDAASASAPVALGQLVVQGAGLLGLLVLYLAVTRDMVHRRDRDWWRWAAVAGGLVFFAGNGVRFLGQNGPEIAGRLSTFTYVPISILAAIGLVRGVQLIPAKDADGHRWRAAAPAIDVVLPGGWNLYSRVAAGSAMITLLMIGARAGGWPPIASILPGPYLAGGYERSVDAFGVASADWQRTTLGPGNRVGGDATSVSLASTYGRQDPVREVGPLYYADAWGLAEDDLVQRLYVQYLVVDRRLSTQLPESGAYFESDPRSGQITSPLTAEQLGKFDALAGYHRLYDNGNVRIYGTGVQ